MKMQLIQNKVIRESLKFIPKLIPMYTMESLMSSQCITFLFTDGLNSQELIRKLSQNIFHQIFVSLLPLVWKLKKK